jgi:hypothetical protein
MASIALTLSHAPEVSHEQRVGAMLAIALEQRVGAMLAIALEQRGKLYALQKMATIW